MTNGTGGGQSSAGSAGGPATTGKKRGWASKLKFAIFLIVVLPVLAIALWTWASLHWSYSSGSRAGFVQKFSRRGWICKTWEGELAMVNLPGSMPEIFQFTVRDEAVARQITSVMGQRVNLTYEQHVGVPTSCFGDTQYFVTQVTPIAP